MTEKLATILYDQVLSYETIFSIHGGCALTYIKGHNDTKALKDEDRKCPDQILYSGMMNVKK